MIYKWVKRILLLLVLVSVVLGIALAMGWMGLQYVPLLIQGLIVTTGLFVFYQTRREKVQLSWLAWPVMVVHILVLPLVIIMAIALKREALAQEYWFVVNLCMLICLGIAWLLLLAGLPLVRWTKVLLTTLSTVYLVLLALHMCGQFSNGKVIFFSGILLFLGTVILVFFGIRKPQVPETPPTAE